MADPVLFDAAYPGPGDPQVNGCLFYLGGDTPHVWTDTEIREAPGRFRLATWVRSNPTQVNPLVDAQSCVNALKTVGYPPGKAVALDLETAVDPAYVNTFGATLHAAGWLVWPYGSKSTLFKNPALDGYFPSDPTGIDHVNPGWVACQFSYDGSYDEDDITQPGLLWDLQAAPTPITAPPVPQEGTDMADIAAFYDPDSKQQHVLRDRTDGTVDHWYYTHGGTGWAYEKLPAPPN